MSVTDPPVASGVTPADVAVLLRARTKDDQGREVGLFTEATRPTLGQVEQAITLAERTVRTRVGVPGSACAESFATAVVHEAACQIEKSYWPEQVLSERSPYVQLRVEAEAAITGLRTCIADTGPTPEEGGRAFVYDLRTPSSTSEQDYAVSPLGLPAETHGNWNPPDPVED